MPEGWAKGLTKETDPRIAARAKATSIGQTGKPHRLSPEAEARRIAACRTSEYRRKAAERAAKHHSNGVHPHCQTRPERILLMFLYQAGFRVIAQKRFGRYAVDAWLPDYSLIFEADGAYWHAYNERHNPGYHARRERFLARAGQDVVHLSDSELLSIDVFQT